jgi:hypothetical protein
VIVAIGIALVVVVVAAALLLMTVFGKSGGALRRLVLATRVPISEVRGGEVVKIQGRVESAGAQPIVTLVDCHEMVCSHVSLTYHYQGSRFVEADRNNSFVVGDGTGEAVIRTDNVTIQFGDRSARGRLDGASIVGWVRTTLERDGLQFSGTPAGRVDVDEQYLAPGDEVAVLGLGRWELGDGEASGRPRLIISADSEIGVVISGHRSTFDD